jgi:hypothetical protein
MKKQYVVELDGVSFVVTSGPGGWLRQVTPDGEDGGTIFPPFTVVKTVNDDDRTISVA